MGWTKRQIIGQAYAEVGKGDYEFDLEPDELQSALRQLDTMVAGWANKGIRIGFSGGNGLGDITADNEAPEWAVEALYLNLAIRLAPSFGKTPSMDTKASAKEAMNGIMVRSARIGVRRLRGYAGSGSCYSNLPTEELPVVAETGSTIVYGRG